jgi:hypothetical protein
MYFKLNTNRKYNFKYLTRDELSDFETLLITIDLQ